MQFANLLELRDLSIRNSLLSRMPRDERLELLKAIEEGFAEGTMVWRKEYLPTLLGEQEADKILDTRVDIATKGSLR